MFWVDASRLRAWFRCSFEWWLRHGMGLTSAEEGVKLKAGTAVHVAMACHFRGGLPSECLEAFHADYDEWASQHITDPESPYRVENLQRIILNWVQTHPLASLPFTIDPDMVEVPFEVPLTEDVLLLGRPDAIPQFNGRYIVLDHKSTSSALLGKWGEGWIEQWEHDQVIATYLYGTKKALESKMGEPVELGGMILNAIQIKEIPSSNKKCKEHEVKYSECGIQHLQSRLTHPIYREPEDIEEWRLDAIGAAESMQQLLADAPDLSFALDVQRQGRFTGACRYCEFKEPCKNGRSPLLLERSLVYDLWDPRNLWEPLPLERKALSTPRSE